MKKDISIPSLQGRLALVTGANSGIGFGIAERLAAAGAEVIMAVRNADKGNIAARLIRSKNPSANLRLELVDLADLQSVNKFSKRMTSESRPVDYLFNNAGLMAPPQRQTSVDGLELHFAANYLGHFALTSQLLPMLIAADRARVVMISSTTARFARINFDDLQSENKYSSDRAYAQSKLAMLMFAITLHRKVLDKGWQIISNAAHPGATRTNIQLPVTDVNGRKGRQSLLTRIGIRLPGIWQDVEQGCLPALYAGISPDAIGGGYYGPDGILELNGIPTRAKIPALALNDVVRERLWEESEKLAGIQFI